MFIDLTKIYTKYCDKYCQCVSRRVQKKYAPLIEDFKHKWHVYHFTKIILGHIVKLKLSGSYKRKDIVRIFTEFGFIVTCYTREYGRTIVYFKSSSNSE